MSTPVKTKKTPIRRCIGCSESFNKNELIRVVRTPDGEIKLDFTGKANGRGAYLCKKTSCFKKARKQGRLKQNLNCEIPEEVLNQLEAEIMASENE